MPTPPLPLPASFAEDPPRQAVDRDRFILRLESYEGPIDLLLDQARGQKVDLGRISILDLADQYLEFISQARSLRLEIAADYLVMAAWLAYLKSRLLLPQTSDDDEPSGEELAEALAFQLRRLEAMRCAADALEEGALLGRDIWPRGVWVEQPAPSGRAVFDESLYDLLASYGRIQSRRLRHDGGLRIGLPRLTSVEAALARLRSLLGPTADWSMLSSFLPSDPGDGLTRRSHVAATLAASLELARSGRIDLRQDVAFAPIYLRARADSEQSP